MFKFNDKNKNNNNQSQKNEKNNFENNKKNESSFNEDLKHEEQKRDSQINNNQNNNNNKENLEKNENNFDKNNHDIKHDNKSDLKKLNQEIESLKSENKIKQERMQYLEKQIKRLNDTFKNEVIKKAQEAQIKLDEKIKEYQTKYEQEIKHNKKYALKNPAIELIDIISNFDIAVNSKAPSPEIANYLKGFQMFANMFKNFLSQNGINEITVNINDEFNAEIMQAFETEKRNGISSNKVLKIVKKGYKLHDIVIVPVTVIVSE